MPNTIQIKRRVSGIAGAPSALKSGEIAHNEVDGVLYIGMGDDGGGNATSIVPFSGKGAFIDRSSAQTISGAKTFSTPPKAGADAAAGNDLVRKSQMDAGLAGKAPLNSPDFTGAPTAPTPGGTDDSARIATTAFVQSKVTALGAGDMNKAVYDANDDGKVDAAEVADSVAWSGVTGKPTSFTPAPHNHPVSEVSGLQATLDAKAPLASPAFTGSPTAPTAATATSNTQLATTAFVQAVVASLIDSAPGALDTLNEIAAALGDDPNFAATITSGLADRLEKSSNLSDLTNTATARTNLGLGTMAMQDANAVAITGGSLDGIEIDCGTF